MQRALRGLAMAIAWVAGAGVAAAQPPGLVPIPWKEAGFETNHPQGAPVSVDVCTEFDCELSEPAPDGRLSLDLNGAHLEFDLVSRVAGNRWEYGIENIVLAGGPDLEVVSVSLLATASFDVPPVPGERTTHVAFVENERGFPTGSRLGVSSVRAFLPGDTTSESVSISWTIFVLAPGEPVTRCQFRRQPGIVLDDCVDSVEIFLPGPPARAR